jgi:DNA-binding NtrC family response regulator
MTAFSSVDTAVEPMRLGSFHYVTKPFDVDEIVMLAKSALERSGSVERFAR